MESSISDYKEADGCWNCARNAHCWMIPHRDKCMRYKKLGRKYKFNTEQYTEH